MVARTTRKKVKVPLYGQVNKVALMEDGATRGATIGTDLFYGDGSIVTLENLAVALGVEASAGASAGGVGGLSRTLWGLISEIPPNIVEAAALSTVGLVTRQTSGGWITRAIAVADINRLTVATADGDVSNPTLDMADLPALSVWGRATNTTGKPSSIQAGTNDRLLTRVADVVSFTQLTAGMFPALVVPDAALSANVALLARDPQAFTGSNLFGGQVHFDDELFLEAAAEVLNAGTTNNWNPAGLSSSNVLAITPATSVEFLSGIEAPSPLEDKLIFLFNSGTNVDFYITSEDVGSTAANRFALPADSVVVVKRRSAVALRYDTTLSRWTVLDPVGGVPDFPSTPAPVAGTQNDWNGGGITRYSGANAVLHVDPINSATLTGLTLSRQGRFLVITNVDSASFTLTLSHLSASSAIGNRFDCPGAVDYVLQARSSVLLIGASGAASGWFVLPMYSRAEDGTAASPARTLSFRADADTGFYRIGADNVGLSLGGTLRVDYNTTRQLLAIALHAADGTVALPALAFGTDTDTGLYRIGANNLGFAANGVLSFDYDAVRVLFALPIYLQNGVAATPGITFGSDPDSGFYRIGADNVGAAANGALVWDWNAARINFDVPAQLQGYTVATLPAGVQGYTAYVTDALAPAFLTAVVGGGAIVTPVFHDGTNWVAI